MAIVKYSAIVEGVTGKLSGSTFFISPGKNILRTNANRVRKDKIGNQFQKGNFISSASKWKKLSKTQRAGWNLLASSPGMFLQNKNNSKRTGMQMYILVNYYRFLRSLLPINAVPTNQTWPKVDEWSPQLRTSPNSLTVFITAPGNTGSNTLFVFASEPVKNGYGHSHAKMKFLGSLPYFMSSTLTFTSAYISAFGIFPVVGEYIKLVTVTAKTANNIPSSKRIFVLHAT